jgi:hypothetical protein
VHVLPLALRKLRKTPEWRISPMAKKPKLMVVVNPVRTGISPPRKLGEHGTALWTAVNAEYNISDSGGIQLLYQACAAAQRAEDLAAIIAEDGEVIHTKNGMKAHPCLKDELAARSFVVRTLSRLGITTENVKPVGRPSQGFGWQGDR